MHESCRECQRLNPGVDMTATADDFYASGSMLPPSAEGDGGDDDMGRMPSLSTESDDSDIPPLFKCYNDKRRLCKRDCNLDSCLPKTNLYSSAGNLSAAPADIPGSPNYIDASDPACQERLRRRVTVFKVGGTFLGDGDACAGALLELMRAKLEKPLSYIVRMRDSGRVRHARLLQLQLVRLCACSIPNHWMRTMPPTQTEGAAAFADEATGNAAALILDFGRSPDDRAALARTRAKQTGKNGGIGMSDYARRRFPSFLASAVTSQRACARVYPALGEMSLTPPNTATATALVAAHGVIDSALADVRTRHAALDEQVRHWVDGTARSAYHPHLKRGFQLPPLAALLGDADGTSSSCLSQHSLSAVVNNDAWLIAKDACDSFDSQNAGATVPHREATSLISHSQVGSGAWLLRLPDATVPRSIIPSDTFLSACQHRLGLYLTALDDVYNALEERGVTVTQHQRLGDHCLNSANATHRHNAALAAVHRALNKSCVDFVDEALDPQSSWLAAAATLEMGDEADDGVAANVNHFAELMESGLKPVRACRGSWVEAADQCRVVSRSSAAEAEAEAASAA